MERFRFVGGQQLLLNGIRIELKRILPYENEETWEVENLVKHMRFPVKKRKLEVEYEKGRLIPIRPDGSLGRRYKGVKLASDLPGPLPKINQFEKRLVAEVERQWFAGITTARDPKTKEPVFQRLLRQLGQELGTEILGYPVTVGVTYYYAIRKRVREARSSGRLANLNGNRGKWERLGPGVRTAIVEAIRGMVDRQKAKGKGLITRKQIIKHAKDEVKKLRENNPLGVENPKTTLATPHDKTLYRMLRLEVDAHDLVQVTMGRSFANAEHRGPSLVPNKTTYANQWQMFDETPAPLHLILKHLDGIPLGRPNITFLVDDYCEGISGFHVGFTPPSGTIIAATLKHGILPKTYASELFPGVTKPLLLSGICKLVTFDRSLQARGDAIAQICDDLDIEFDWTPSRHPWLKDLVEKFFQRLAQQLLRDLPGYVFPPWMGISEADYNPRKDGIIDFYEFLALLHAWVAEINATPRNGKPSPNEMWAESAARVEPEYVADTAALDALFGTPDRGKRLDNKGVQYKGLPYYSEHLRDYRWTRGASQWVNLKVNELNLRMLHVELDDGSFVPAYTIKHPEVDPLPAFLVDILRKSAQQRYKNDSAEAQEASFRDLRRAMAVGLGDQLSVRESERLGRILGLEMSTVLMG